MYGKAFAGDDASPEETKFGDSLLSCLDETNIAVVHKLTKKVLDATSNDCAAADNLPSRGTLRNYSLRLLKTLGTDIDVPLSGGGSMKITVIRPQEAIPYLLPLLQKYYCRH